MRDFLPYLKSILLGLVRGLSGRFTENAQEAAKSSPVAKPVPIKRQDAPQKSEEPEKPDDDFSWASPAVRKAFARNVQAAAERPKAADQKPAEETPAGLLQSIIRSVMDAIPKRKIDHQKQTEKIQSEIREEPNPRKQEQRRQPDQETPRKPDEKRPAGISQRILAAFSKPAQLPEQSKPSPQKPQTWREFLFGNPKEQARQRPAEQETKNQSSDPVTPSKSQAVTEDRPRIVFRPATKDMSPPPRRRPLSNESIKAAFQRPEVPIQQTPAQPPQEKPEERPQPKPAHGPGLRGIVSRGVTGFRMGGVWGGVAGVVSGIGSQLEANRKSQEQKQEEPSGRVNHGRLISMMGKPQEEVNKERESMSNPVKPETGVLDKFFDKFKQYGGIVGKLAAVTYGSYKALELFGTKVVESREYLRNFNGVINAAYGRLDNQQIRLNMQTGSATQGSTANLVNAMAEFRESGQANKQALMTIVNTSATVGLKIASGIAKGVEMLNVLIPIANMIEGNTREGDKNNELPVNVFLKDLAKGDAAKSHRQPMRPL